MLSPASDGSLGDASPCAALCYHYTTAKRDHIIAQTFWTKFVGRHAIEPSVVQLAGGQ